MAMQQQRPDPDGPGGFTADSWRAAPQKAQAPRLTGAQQKLARLEKALPRALQSAAAGVLACVLALAIGVFGIGGAKLHSRYTAVQQAFVTGTAEDTQWGGDYSVMAQLSARGNAAANVITSAGNDLGKDNARVQEARQALDDFNAALDGDAGPAALYDANAALGTAVDALYAELQAGSDTPLQMGAVQSQYSAFNSAGVVLGQLTYNEMAQDYNEAASGLPASLAAALWNCKEAELFA